MENESIYDLHAPYKEEYKLTLIEFVNNISFYQDEECQKEKNIENDNYTNIPQSIDTTAKLNHIKNNQKTGVMDRIVNGLHFNIEEMAKVSAEERFNMFKLIKVVYDLERIKHSNTSWMITNQDKGRVPITKILQKPRLSNIKANSTQKTVYGEEFQELYDKIKSILPEEEVKYKEETISKIILMWDEINQYLFTFFTLDSSIQHKNEVLDRLKYLNNWLKIIYNRLNLEKPYKITNTEKIMPTFFNILLSHKMACLFVELNKNNKNTENNNKNTKKNNKKKKNKNNNIDSNYYITNQDFLEFISQYEWYKITYETIERFEKYCTDKIKKVSEEEDKLFKYIQYLIYVGFNDKFTGDKLKLNKLKMDTKDICFAVKYLKTALNMFFPDTTENSFFDQNGVAMSLFLTIMQELIYLHNKEITYLDDYVGSKYSNIKLTAVFKNFERDKKADATAIANIKNRLEYRYLVNIGGKEFLEQKQAINARIYDIITYLLKYQNFDDMVFASDFLYNLVFRKLKRSIEEPKYTPQEFFEKLQSLCPKQQFEFHFQHISSYNLLYEDTTLIDTVMQEIATVLNNTKCKFYEEKVSVTKKVVGINSYNTEIIQHFFRDGNTIIFLEQFEVADDEYITQAKALGLDTFCR